MRKVMPGALLENMRDLGVVDGPSARLALAFKRPLLIRAVPE